MYNNAVKRVYRGEIYFANMIGKGSIGSEQGGTRPVLIIQNDIGNKFSPTTIVAEITSANKSAIPTHLDIKLIKPSTILFEQITTIDKSRLQEKIGEIPSEMVDEMNNKLMVSLGLI